MIVISLFILVGLIAVDQATKLLVASYIPLKGTAFTLSIGDFNILSITHVRNDGAAWSMLSGKTWLLIIVAAAAIAVAFYFIITDKIKSRFGVISLVAVISGGIGNLIDRIRLGEVVDFIKTEFVSFPVFNFADICVVVGAVCFCSWVIFSDTKGKKDKNKAEISKGELKSGED